MDSLHPRIAKKAMLYAMQYPTADVIGVFTDEDFFPLFHTPPSALYTEIALQMLHDQNIIGFFEAVNRSSNLPGKPSKIMESLCTSFTENMKRKAMVLSLEKQNDEFIFKLDRWDTNKFTNINEFPVPEDLPRDRIRLVDFDMHFEDCTLDWRNTHVE